MVVVHLVGLETGGLVETVTRARRLATGICDQPLTELLWWPAELGEISLGVSVVAYAGKVRFGVSCDTSLGLDPEIMANNMAAACETL